jgi:two-component system CheB/CheR fusion protein
VLENIPTAVLVVDEALQISRASAAAVELFRLRSSEPRAHLSQCAAPPGFPSLPEICNEAIRLGQPSQGEAVSRERMFLMTCAPYRNTSGRVTGATMVFTETPVAMKLSRQLQRALDESPVMMLHLDAAGRILGLSAAMAELLGVGADEALGHPAAEALGSDVARAMAAADARFLAAGETDGRGIAPEEIAFTDRRGARRWVAFRSHRHTPEGGGESVYRIGLEVTELRRKREELARRNQQMALAQEMAGVGYWSYDASTKALYWSEALYRIHGAAPGAPVPSFAQMLDFYHPDDRAAAAAAFDGALTQGRDARLKLRIVTPSGCETPIECWITVEAADDDGARRLLGVFRRL